MNTDASILDTIKAVPDISSPEIAHLLDIAHLLNIAPSNVSARLSLLYRQGNLRRKKKQVEGARKPPFAYRWQEGFVPDPERLPAQHQSPGGADHRRCYRAC